MDLMTSGSLGLAIISSLLQLTGEPTSGERSPGFPVVACRVAAESGRFIMYNMLPMRLDTYGGNLTHISTLAIKYEMLYLWRLGRAVEGGHSQ